MRIQTITLSAVLAMAAMAWSQVRNPPGIGLHPGYNLALVRPDSFQPQVCGLDFLPDGSMVVVTWKGGTTPMWQPYNGRWGEAFRLEGIDGPRANIRVTKIATGFKDAQGVWVVGNDIYVGDVDRIVKLTNPDANGMYQGKQTIGSYPSSPDGWFEYSFGPVYTGGYFYMALAVHVQASGWPATQRVSDRSTVIRIPLAGGNYQVVASGLRAPDGIGLGPKGEVFVTDNQGGWLPSCKIINVVQGRFYGYRLTPASQFQSLPMTQPSLWLTYGTSDGGISHSPTELQAMPAGIFKGQMLFGDVSRGGLYRAFLEEVQDPATNRPEYQGAVFPFTGGLEAGIHRLRIRPNGDIIVGGLGNGEQTNKGWFGTRFGLQKLSAKPGVTAFEMLAVRSRRNGMEIEFTKPVDNSGGVAANYRVETWNMVPQECYGCGNKQNRAGLTVGQVQVSSDRTKVYLPLTGMRAGGYVVRIRVSNVRSQAGDSLLYDETQYTLRAISPSDPFTPPTSVQAAAEMPHWTLEPTAAGVEMRLPPNPGMLEIADIRGRTVFSQAARGGEVIRLSSARLGRGVFVAKWITPQGEHRKPPFYLAP